MKYLDNILSIFDTTEPDQLDSTLSDALSADGVNLADVRAEALQAYKTASESDTQSDEQIDYLERLVAVADAVSVQITARAAEDTARAERVAALSERMTALDEPEPVVDVVADPVDVVESPVALEGEIMERELVTAAVAKPRLGDLPSSTVIVPVEKESRWTMVAAAGIPDIEGGSQLENIDKLTSAVTKRMAGLGRAGVNTSVGIASLFRNRSLDRTISSDSDEEISYRIIEEAAKIPSNLVAAGWCSPSDTFYDLCAPAGLDGLVDLPEVTASRGGVRYPNGLDFGAIYAGIFHQTEVQAIAGTTKPCITVPCPTFTDTRLDVVGICIRSGILTNRAYPELIRNLIANALAAHAHRANEVVLEKMVVASDPIAIAGTDVANQPNFGAATTALEYAEFSAEWVRYQNRRPVNEMIEVVAPLWARGAFRADLSKKNGVDLFRVSDSDIVAYFAARHIRIQFVYDWQDALSTGTATDFGGATLPTDPAWPAVLGLLVYPAGTFVKLTADVITLDGVYDAASLSTNDFTALFTEEGINVVKRCYRSIYLTFPTCTSGLSGAQAAPACANATALPAPA